MREDQGLKLLAAGAELFCKRRLVLDRDGNEAEAPIEVADDVG